MLWRNGSQEKLCGLGTYHDSLTLAFKNATAELGETLVTVQVLPSLHREYALVLKRVGPNVHLLRVAFRDKLWTQLGLLQSPKTRQQCIELAIAAKVDVVDLSARGTEQLWNTFSNIKLDTDTCPRRNGKCVLPQDGTDYVVQTNGGRSEWLTEVGTL